MTFSVEPSNRCCDTTATFLPDARSAARMRSAASREMAMGFSIMTCFPAWSAATAWSAWDPLGVQIDTASMSGSASTAS
jgi:hypothetical protein